MHGLGHQLFSGATFAVISMVSPVGAAREIRLCKACHRRPGTDHHRRNPCMFGGRQRPVVVEQSPMGDCPLNELFEPIGSERFFDVVEGSVPHRFDGRARRWRTP